MKKMIMICVALMMTVAGMAQELHTLPEGTPDTGTYVIATRNSDGIYTTVKIPVALLGSGGGGATVDTTYTFDTSGVTVVSFFSTGWSAPVSTSNATCVIDIWFDVTALSGSALYFNVDYTDETGTSRNVSTNVANSTGEGWAHYVARVEASHGLSVGMIATGGTVSFNWGMVLRVGK